MYTLYRNIHSTQINQRMIDSLLCITISFTEPNGYLFIVYYLIQTGDELTRSQIKILSNNLIYLKSYFWCLTSTPYE